jgi:predicted nucleotidyltransferase
MDRDQIVSTLRSHASDLQVLGASSLFLFGSVARNEATSASDVDLFFEFDNPSFSLIELVHTRADVMSRGSIHPKLRSAIEGSAFQVF